MKTSYSNFEETVVKELEALLLTQEIDASVCCQTVTKVNEEYRAVSVMPKDSSIGICLNMSELYENGLDHSEAARQILDSYLKAMPEAPGIDTESIFEYSRAKTRLFTETISTEQNRELLRTLPHREIKDLSVIVRVLAADGTGNGNTASSIVNREMAAAYGVSDDDLISDAARNSERIRPITIAEITDVLARSGFDCPRAAGDALLYVVTVPDGFMGAGTIAYPDFFTEIQNTVGRDYYLIPSSIHEFLALPDTGDHSVSVLEDLVRSVNDTEVSPRDFLSNRVYHYDCGRKLFEYASEYEQRTEEEG